MPWIFKTNYFRFTLKNRSTINHNLIYPCTPPPIHSHERHPSATKGFIFSCLHHVLLRGSDSPQLKPPPPGTGRQSSLVGVNFPFQRANILQWSRAVARKYLHGGSSSYHWHPLSVLVGASLSSTSVVVILLHVPPIECSSEKPKFQE